MPLSDVLPSSSGNLRLVTLQDLANRAKALADEIHGKIPWFKVREWFKVTAVTFAARRDGSVVAVVSGSGRGLESASVEHVQSLTTHDEFGRPNMVLATNIPDTHAERNAVIYMAENDLRPLAGAAYLNACSPEGCNELVQKVGATMYGPITIATKKKIPGQAQYFWGDYQAWSRYVEHGE
ncbi:hypothetical protein ACIGEZ_32380 [Streptomyces sp. NPDC085481]|uniref:hypothetical protein n=1 Tax=Streptomyces sp. NPDC085481 TaxID=3365727 RepID=UPI0037D3ED3F